MLELGPDFKHLRVVARAAVNRGDPSIATILFQSYTDQAKRFHKFELKRIAALKAQAIAEVLAGHKPNDLSRLPNPSNDPPQAWGAVKPRKTDPVQLMRLNSHQQWAISEIRQIYNATIRAVMPVSKPMDAIKVDRSRTIHDPLKYMEGFSPERLNRYFKWTWRNRTIDGLDLTGFELVCAIVIDGYGLRDLARIHLKHVEYVRRQFRKILGDY